jgi:hypothetical protein
VTLAFFSSSEQKVRAGTTAVGQEEEVFLDITEPVWTPASASEGRLVGQHRFPFSITLPRDATIAPVPQAAPKSFLLPPTFSERASPAYIDYRLFVTVRRGRLRVDKQCVLQCPRIVSRLVLSPHHHHARRLTAICGGAHSLSTNFAFLPRSVAKPPSALRALAYAEGGVILGPDADPEGWKVYDPIKITGTLFKAREASVQCTVSGPFALPFVGQPTHHR